MNTLCNIKYGEKKQNILDMYLPEKSNFPVIIYFHGGGLENGSKSDFQLAEFGSKFVENGYGFISVEYSLYTQGAKFPEFVDDCALAVAFVKKNISSYGGNGSIYISGQSAGAWISLMLCTNKVFLEKYGVINSDIAGWIIDSAQTTSHFNVIKYELNANPKKQMINEYAPLYYVDENTVFSKMLLIYYENDMPCRPEQTRLFGSAVKNYNPNANIKLLELKGGHVFGSTYKDEDGEFPYIKEALKWLKAN